MNGSPCNLRQGIEMALTSTIHRAIPQGADQLVTEHHVDSSGAIHVWTYCASPSADTAALLAEHSAQMAESLAEQEAGEIIDG